MNTDTRIWIIDILASISLGESNAIYFHAMHHIDVATHNGCICINVWRNDTGLAGDNGSATREIDIRQDNGARGNVHIRER